MKKNPLTSTQVARVKHHRVMLNLFSNYLEQAHLDLYECQLAMESGSRADISLGKLCTSVKREVLTIKNLREALADIAADHPTLL